MKKIFIKSFIFLYLQVCFIYNTSAQPGNLDKSFGTDGKTVTENTFKLFSLAIQRNGNIIAGGQGTSIIGTPNTSLFAVRYTPDGILDNSFGENGILKYAPEDYILTEGQYAIVQPDDKIIVAGNGYKDYYYSNAVFDWIGNYNLILRRYMPDGTPDSSFGENSVVITDFGERDFVKEVALQTDGKIIVAGGRSFDYGGTDSFLICRYLPNGMLDESFGDKGKVFDDFGECSSLVIQRDGKILVGGTTSGRSFIFFRYNSDGTRDITFDHDGKLFTDLTKYGEYLRDIAVQDDGKILAAGLSNYRFEPKEYFGDMVVLRYNDDGSFDSTFGINGRKDIKFDTSSDARSVSIQKNGKIVLAGLVTNDYISYSDFALARLNTDGSLDTTFGVEGKQKLDIDVSDGFNASLILNDGKILAGGYTYSAVPYPGAFVLTRYFGDPIQQSLITKIKRWIRNHILNFQDANANNTAYYVIEKSNNSSNGFKEVATINPSTVNRQPTTEYSYALPSTSTESLYRIKAVSNDGGVAYSDVIADESTFQPINSSTLQLSPNPVKDVLHVQGLSASPQGVLWTNKTTLIISNIQGNVIKRVSMQADSYDFDVSTLKPGTYYLKADTDKTSNTYRFIKE